jgi:DNA-damage-inducible protein J
MAKTETIRARVEPALKHEAEAVFSQLGLSATEAITLFYKQVTLQHGLPFAVKLPNAETREALQQAKALASRQGAGAAEAADDANAPAG